MTPANLTSHSAGDLESGPLLKTGGENSSLKKKFASLWQLGKETYNESSTKEKAGFAVQEAIGCVGMFSAFGAAINAVGSGVFHAAGKSTHILTAVNAGALGGAIGGLVALPLNQILIALAADENGRISKMQVYGLLLLNAAMHLGMTAMGKAILSDDKLSMSEVMAQDATGVAIVSAGAMIINAIRPS